MTRIVAVHPVLPVNSYPQHSITQMMADTCGAPADRRALMTRVHGSSQVGSRHLALPLGDYAALNGFEAANRTLREQLPIALLATLIPVKILASAMRG